VSKVIRWPVDKKTSAPPITSHSSTGSTGVGLYGLVSVELTDMDPGKLTANLRFGGDTFPDSQPSTWLWGATLSLGFRY